MSSLLQAVLNSRLSNTTLESESNDSPTAKGAAAVEGFNDWEQVDSDEELVNVRSAPQTTVGTPLERSRPSSPTPEAGYSASAGPSSRLAVETDTTDQDSGEDATAPNRSREKGEKQLPSTKSRSSRKRTSAHPPSKLDPLRAFNNEISQHIFLQLSVESLLACSGVCKRWRRSATLNYCWYKHYQHNFSASSLDTQFLQLPAWGSGGAKWTRRESKTDWKTQFGKQKRMEQKEAARLDSLPGSGSVTPSRTQRLQEAGILTTQEQRQLQWKEEADAQYTKSEMRDYYKSGPKGGKFKGKREKGGVKTGAAGDGGLWQ